jgi:UDP-N-acetylmuramyl pentapeptide phosphotransferase/UDP-N-acetylglucosamine-1-phosphate transferase
MIQNNLILLFVLTVFVITFYKYFPKIINKYNTSLLIDDQFKKPQAFHTAPVSTTGGLGLFLAFSILCIYFFASAKTVYLEYFLFCALFFLLGFSDDLKLNIRPKFRLIIMMLLLIFLIIFNKLYILNTGIEFLNRFLEIDIFSLFFISICFLFIINGSNLIDGYNGLLGIHALIILINLCLINYTNGNNDLAFFILSGVLILSIFLKYNFPKAVIFLGDGGSYFLGAFIALSVIKTSIANPSVSPFYFCILLFYLFFEVFFSFIRKVFIERKSPLFPDKKHLHMLIYKSFVKKYKNKVKSNYYVSILINSIFLLMTVPAIFMKENGLFCKYYSILFFLFYLSSYKMLYEKKK